MNCKQGDLAVVVRALLPENVGKVVRCIRFIPQGTQTGSGVTGLPGWETDIELTVCSPTGKIKGRKHWAADASLHPLRDNPGEDETLTWAGKPERIEA